MIMKFLRKIPAGMMIVPLFLAVVLNTFVPQFFNLGSFTTALFKNGSAPLMGMLFFVLGTNLRLKDMGKAVKRATVLLLAKLIIAVILGVAVGFIFGKAGVFMITSMAIISAVSNDNGSVYLTLMKEYGDEADCASMPLICLNDGPFLTMIAMGMTGLADIPLTALIATIIPMALGMLAGNLDKDVAEFVEPAGSILIPFIAFSLGSSISLTSIIVGGPQGIILGLVTVFIGGGFTLLLDKYISRRPGYAAWAEANTAGNAVAVPAAIALADPSWAPYVELATTQVAAAVIVTAILSPLMTVWWVKRHGSPKYPLNGKTI